MNVKKRLYIGLILLIIGVSLSGCGPSPEEQAVASATNTPPSLEEQTITITVTNTPSPEPDSNAMLPWVWAIVPETNENVESSIAQVEDLIEERTGMVIETVVLEDYLQLVNGLCSGDYHFGVLPPFSYLLAVGNGCTQGSLIAKRYDSTSSISQILIHHESDISRVADLTGAVFCRTSSESMSSWIIPSLMMRAEGIDPEQDLAGIIDSGNPEEIISAIYNGDCDAGATYINSLIPLQDEYPDVLDVVTILAESIWIPNNSFTFSPDIPTEVRVELENVLRNLESINEGQVLNDLYGCEGFQETDDAFYDQMRMLINAAGVDIESLVP